MPRTDLNDIAAFLAVARERSFTRAAAQLGISQSALSQTIRSLLHNRLRERRVDVFWCALVLTALAKHDSIVALPRHGSSDGAPFS